MRYSGFAVLAAFVLLGVLVTRGEALDEAELPKRADFGTYALDDFPRMLPVRGREPRCPTESIVNYQGTSIRYWLNAPMHQAFVPYVQRLEELVREVSIEHYGRAPYRLSHMGAYVCRPMRGHSAVISEHALGNALDLRGFDFLPARPSEPLPEGAPRSVARSFRITVEEHWRATSGTAAYHAAFFAKLTERLSAEPELFGVMLGPSYPAHDRHLHLDRAPWSFVRF
ncbi:MAG: extensin family protein [Polyangiales bacterium]